MTLNYIYVDHYWDHLFVSYFFQLEPIIGISNQPSELSYVSVSGEMSDDPNSGGPEGKKASISGGDISSTPQNREAKAPPFSRCYSEQTAMTPKTKRKYSQKCYSEMPSMSLKPGNKTFLL